MLPLAGAAFNPRAVWLASLGHLRGSVTPKYATDDPIMLGWIFCDLSALAACLWGRWLAIGNAVVNFRSLGIMHNRADETGIHAPARNDWKRLVITINAVTSLIGVELFIARIATR